MKRKRIIVVWIIGLAGSIAADYASAGFFDWLGDNLGLGCGAVPRSKPGMVILENDSRVSRDIYIFPGFYSVKRLKAVDPETGNEIFAVPPLRLRQEDSCLVFRSEDAYGASSGEMTTSFTMPPAYVKFKGGRIASQAAVVYFKPESRYTIYIRDFDVTGQFVGEHTRSVRTSREATRECERTYLGTVCADDIVSLPRAKIGGPTNRLGIHVTVP